MKHEGGILNTIRQCGFSLEGLAEIYPELNILKDVPQNPLYHGEGDVYCHTRMVCRELKRLEEWDSLTLREQELLVLAGAFHDIGKPSCTRLEEGTWTSPRHTIEGEKVFRAMAYRGQQSFGLTWEEREMAAKLIRFHGLPLWFLKKRRPEQEILKAAESVPLKLLYLLSKGDVRGRISKAGENLEEPVELFKEMAGELGVWEHPFSFANAYTRYAYFHRDDLWEGSSLFDDTSFDVWMMAGLPLSGKDTWIQNHGGGFPVISLDDIRQEYGISPKNNSGKVVQIAIQRARELMRKKASLIWNATSLIADHRKSLCSLFSAYGARVRLIYLEVPYEELLDRNKKRERTIPPDVLERMIDRMEMPAPWETYSWTKI
ncbi:MAG: AAA family ATPase [Hungatella sp.]|nr:AAA family ATPase [Hungatella sp.]